MGTESRISRRALVQRALFGLAGFGLLAACAPAAPAAKPTEAPAAPAKPAEAARPAEAAKPAAAAPAAPAAAPTVAPAAAAKPAEAAKPAAKAPDANPGRQYIGKLEGPDVVPNAPRPAKLGEAPMLAEQFETLRAEHERRVDVQIVSAAPVDAAQQKALVDAVKKKLDRDVNVEWKTDPSLIAGAQIRAGDTVIDGSISGELARLRQALIG